MANPVSPLDFETIASYVFGNADMFVYVLLIVFSIVAAKLRMPISAYLILMFVFMLMMYFIFKSPVVIVIVIIVAIVIGFMIARQIKQ